MADLGHVKRNPTTGDVALRTRFDETVPELVNLAWLVASTGMGPRTTSSSEVADWDDLYVPTEAGA